MVRKVLNWTEKKFNDIDESTKHPLLKSFGLGAIEGVIDGMVMMYPLLLASTAILTYKLSKHEK